MHPANHDLARAIIADRRAAVARRAVAYSLRAGPSAVAKNPGLPRLLLLLAGALGRLSRAR